MCLYESLFFHQNEIKLSLRYIIRQITAFLRLFQISSLKYNYTPTRSVDKKATISKHFGFVSIIFTDRKIYTHKKTTTASSESAKTSTAPLLVKKRPFRF